MSARTPNPIDEQAAELQECMASPCHLQLCLYEPDTGKVVLREGVYPGNDPRALRWLADVIEQFDQRRAESGTDCIAHRTGVISLWS